MNVESWSVPIVATSHRATELNQLSFGRGGLSVQVTEENTGARWELRFGEVQAFRCTTEESASTLLGALPVDGGFFEAVDSAWMRELGLGELDYMAGAHHYIICCYEEVIEVVASEHAFERLASIG